MNEIPVVLFAYARPAHLARALACLRGNGVPLVYVFADGAKGAADAAAVAETRALLRAVDWCEMRLTEHGENFGLGRNVLAGVSDVATRHEAFVVWEDDLVSVAGTYAWMCAALRHYAADERVMSVSAWTHPRVTPADVGEAPYLDARAECWVWGAWARSWRGMPEQTARAKMAAAAKRGVTADAYGADLAAMAKVEAKKNIWAVRWLYHHFQHGGLCMRPPWSMVEHIGFDAGATNATAEAVEWENPPLRAAPPVPAVWPDAREHPECRRLWTAAAGPAGRSWAGRWRRVVRRLVPAAVLSPLVERFFRVRWVGNFADWPAAAAAARGYDSDRIFHRVRAAARQVREGRATYERDGVAFHAAAPRWPGVSRLREAAGNGRLTVLDFGGSLGSLYFQARAQLGEIGALRWRVVEQPKFAAAGREEFQNGELEFYTTVTEACDAGMPDVVLLASVLPYLPSPFATLSSLLETGARWIVVERTGFALDGKTRLTVQHVPRSIYAASYPCWFFDRAEFLAQFAGRYRLESESRDEVALPAGLEFHSLHFRRVEP